MATTQAEPTYSEWTLARRHQPGDHSGMIVPPAANDNGRVTWWHQAFPAVLGLVILGAAIRVALAAFF